MVNRYGTFEKKVEHRLKLKDGLPELDSGALEQQEKYAFMLCRNIQWNLIHLQVNYTSQIIKLLPQPLHLQLLSLYANIDAYYAP